MGIDVVRRPTGGRAVLHDHEVTYSVIMRDDDPLAAAGILASYLTISRALIRGLSYLGISAELLPLRRSLSPEALSPVCFATPASYEVAVAGRKLVGSAQRRLRGSIMQHGSLPLSFDLDKMNRVFAIAKPTLSAASAGLHYQTRMTSLQEAGGRQFTYHEVVAALGRGFAETWEVALMADQLTDEERSLGHYLRATKYVSQAWTWHR
jgi:lipoate-protein ligase A